MTTKIKALHWVASEGQRVANTPFGSYRFFEQFSTEIGRTVSMVVFSCCDDFYFQLKSDLTFELACDVAKEDFRKRILDCLV